MASEPYPHHPFTFCATCSSPTHPTQSYPYNASYPEPIENLHTFQNFQRPSYNYPYSEPYNPDWARYLDFSWSQGSYQDSSTDFILHSAPLYPQPPEQPHKPSLEDTLQMFMESTIKFQQSRLGDPLDFTHYSASHSQYPPLFGQPHKPSLEDTLQTFL